MKIVYLVANLGLSQNNWEIVKHKFRSLTNQNYIGVDRANWKKNFRERYDLVIDVGSNYGQFSFALSQLRGYRNLIAIDPHGECGRFVQNIIPNCKFINCAVSDEEGEFVLYYPRLYRFDFLSLSSLREKNVTNWIDTHTPRFLKSKIKIIKKTIPVDTLDNICQSERIDTTSHILLKIDVQGVEDKVISGAKQLIENYRPDVFVEMEFEESKDVAALLADFGYQRCYKRDLDELWKYKKNGK